MPFIFSFHLETNTNRDECKHMKTKKLNILTFFFSFEIGHALCLCMVEHMITLVGSQKTVDGKHTEEDDGGSVWEIERCVSKSGPIWLKLSFFFWGSIVSNTSMSVLGKFSFYKFQ